jgi:hypothetical protein
MAFPGDWLVWLWPYFGGVEWAHDWAQAALQGRWAGTRGRGLDTVLVQKGHVRLQVDLGREASFLWYWDADRQCVELGGERQGEVQCTTEPYRRRRWQATMPVLSLRLAHIYGNSFADDLALRLAFRLGHLNERIIMGSGGGTWVNSGMTMGAVLTLENMTRLYVYP